MGKEAVRTQSSVVVSLHILAGFLEEVTDVKEVVRGRPRRITSIAAEQINSF